LNFKMKKLQPYYRIYGGVFIYKHGISYQIAQNELL
jgi:hypothetical protein